MANKKTLFQGLTYVFLTLLVISVLLCSILESNKATIDAAFGTESSKIETLEGDGLYKAFTPKSKYIKEVQDEMGNSVTYLNSKVFSRDQVQLGRKANAEGSVLLKNKNNALPLKKNNGKVGVTLLGIRSHVMFLGAGQGVQMVGQYVSLETALGGTKTDFVKEKTSGDFRDLTNFEFSDLNIDGRTDGAGAGFNLNNAMIDRYEDLNRTLKVGNNDGPGTPKEANASQISDVPITGYEDAAIIVIGTGTSESSDYSKPTSGNKGPLAITDDEQSIIDYATTRFNKTVVLLNTDCPMEVKSLQDNDKIDAILWVGHPGGFGTLGIADILCGRVSPSGGLADTYVTDNMSAPAMKNFGNYTFTNGSEVAADGGRGSSTKYIIEAEGMYTGYRYYETRYNDIVCKQGNANSAVGATASTGNWNYSEEVVYSFGYGLSYTNFKYEIVNARKEQSPHEKYTIFDIKVSNVGSIAGKTPVELYVQAPYTLNGIEKPAIQLVEFGKTDIIEPGASQTISIEVDWQNIASYDSSYNNADGSKGSYVLEPGDYYFAIGNGAHDALNNILAKKGKKVADGMDYDGNDELVYVEKYADSGVDANTFGYSKANVKVKNQIPYADWNYFEAGKVTYLSRANWSETYPVEYNDMSIPDSMKNDIKGLYYTTKTTDDTSDIIWGDSSVEINFYDLAKMEYDDPRWNDLLNKITLEDAITMAAYGGNTFASAESVGFTGGKLTENTGNGIQTYTPDKPLVDDNCPWRTDKNDGDKKISLKVFCSAPVVASTFSHEVLYEMGEFMGQQAIIIGLPILWGPGGNTHRSAYNGRNGEYYSEDPILTGVACMEFAIGARDNGLIAAPKHFAFNDQETNRGGVAPFMTEQRAREVELRAFQIAFEATSYDRKRGTDTGMLGMMTSLSKIGPVECTCSVGLITGIAREEWNFKGYCVTDIGDDMDLFDCVVIAGCTGYDNRSIGDPSWAKLTAANSAIKNRGEVVTTDHYKGDRKLQLAIKDCCHRTLYTLCQSVLMNQSNSTSRVVQLVTWWRVVYVSLIVLNSLLALGSIVMFVLITIKKGGK